MRERNSLNAERKRKNKEYVIKFAVAAFLKYLHMTGVVNVGFANITR